MVGGHEKVVELLIENGAEINAGDVGHFACTAAEQNNLDLLKEIVHYGGNVTSPRNNGSTALHLAVCEGNIEVVKFLLKKGTDIDKPDVNGWTPRDLAEQQGHEDIKMLFQSCAEIKVQSAKVIPEEEPRYLGRSTSEPNILPVSQDATDGSWSQPRPRRRTNNFLNSPFGIMSAAHNVENDLLLPVHQGSSSKNCNVDPARVIISCPEKGDVTGKLVLLPRNFEDLLDIGAKKFGVIPAKVLSKDGPEIDDIEVTRDGDHLIFVSEAGG